MKIISSSNSDIPEIFRLYHHAVAYQKTKNCTLWPEFSLDLVSEEVKANKQWKLLFGDQVACVWAIAFNDPEIWGEMDADKALYLHRIAVNANFRGLRLVELIVAWAKAFAEENNLDYIRMDTVGENLGLISHYQNCGFQFLGLSKLEETKSLPKHYNGAIVSLFQIKL